MKIDKNKFVSIDYSLRLDSGEVVDQSEPGQPLGFIFDAGQMIPGLERQLAGRNVGDRVQFTVEAEEGYGPSDPELRREIPRRNFPEGIELTPGMSFQASGPHGPISFLVHSVAEDTVVADFNHPLAGKRLHFDVTVSEVREPTEGEMKAAQGHCGGCGGHGDGHGHCH